jgi:hypothetical protein
VYNNDDDNAPLEIDIDLDGVEDIEAAIADAQYKQHF